MNKNRQINDLLAFLAVARERSFTRSAAQLGLTQSALSHTIKTLEERLGLRLLVRTTRNVATTAAGERLLRTIGPRFQEIEAELASLTELRDKPAGNIRITTSAFAAETILMPALAKFVLDYPDIHVEAVIDPGLTNIVAERYDAGIRLGEQVERDMIAVRIGPELRMAAVAAPSYFEAHAKPKVPQDLTRHTCLNMRLQTYGGLYAWEFEKGGRPLNVRVNGQIISNGSAAIVAGALLGLGIAYIPEDMVRKHVAEKTLVRVLGDWCPPFPGYHLYYPGKRQPSAAFSLLIEALRFRK
ncbi:MAG TPA: LysR family transcriptional regulator [Rhizomicrobium sp.]|jgi:DNA-binding transcriptional LysR family regulator